MTTLFIREIPERSKAKFKAWCAEHNLTMQEAVTYLFNNIHKLEIFNDSEITKEIPCQPQQLKKP